MEYDEPWKVYLDRYRYPDRPRICIDDCGDMQVASCGFLSEPDEERYLSIANRIVDCVNGCTGTNPKAVPHLRKACRAALVSLAGDDEYMKFKPVIETLVDALALADRG